MKSPIYEPPNPNARLSKKSERILARLKTAKTAPVIEIQFLIDEGNFMLIILMKHPIFSEPKVGKNRQIIQYQFAIYKSSIYVKTF